jgi:hypothetical protein
MVYSGILLTELLAAGISDVAGCNSGGEVWKADNTRIHERSDVAVIVAAHKSKTYDVDEFGNLRQTEVIFSLPVVAPDFLVGSPKPKSDPVEALVEAMVEGGKVRKSIALIALSLVKHADDVEKRLKKGKL